ncbi:MAG: hypothetical protein WC009_13925 [Methylotenera sp.]
MTPEQTAILRDKIIEIESKKIIASITWSYIEQGLLLLTNDEKDKILKAILGGGTSSVPLIQEKLKSMVKQQAILIVDNYIALGQFPTEYVASII